MNIGTFSRIILRIVDPAVSRKIKLSNVCTDYKVRTRSSYSYYLTVVYSRGGWRGEGYGAEPQADPSPTTAWGEDSRLSAP